MSKTFNERIAKLEDNHSKEFENYIIEEYEKYHSDKPKIENQEQKLMWQRFVECFGRIDVKDFEEWVEKYRIL